MLNVSIVLYHPNWEQVINLTQVLLQSPCVRRIYWIDNSPSSAANLQLPSQQVEYRHNAQNLGYGAAHNIAIRESIYDNIPFHLVINPDILLDFKDLDYMMDFIRQNPLVGSLMPRVTYPDGHLQYLCKLLPTPLDVFVRRFLPSS
jgi:GT2 family glycosyltransferase